MVSRWLVVRALWSQLVFQHRGADEERMRKFRESALRVTRGWDQARVSAIVRDTLTEVIDPIVYDEALDLIRQHQAAGRRVYLISASPEEIVAPLALYLGVDEAIASRASLDEAGRYTGEVEFYSYGPFKADAIRQAADDRGIDLASSYAYSDSITDLPMLETVGHPVAVNPDRELARVARDREWDVLQFRHGVPLRERVSMPARRQTAVGISAVVVTSAAGVGAWWLWRHGRPEHPRASTRPRSPVPGGRSTDRRSGPAATDRGSGVLQLLHRERGEGEDDDEDQELLHGAQLQARPGRSRPAAPARAGAGPGSASGKVRRTMAPPRGESLPASIRVPWARASAATMARPRPVPPVSRPRAGSARTKRSKVTGSMDSGKPGPSSATLSTQAPGTDVHQHLHPRAGVAAGVDQQVHQRLVDAVGIGPGVAGPGHVDVGSVPVQRVRHPLGGGPQVDRGRSQLQLGGADPGQRQQVLGQAPQPNGFIQRALQRGGHLAHVVGSGQRQLELPRRIEMGVRSSWLASSMNMRSLATARSMRSNMALMVRARCSISSLLSGTGAAAPARSPRSRRPPRSGGGRGAARPRPATSRHRPAAR